MKTSTSFFVVLVLLFSAQIALLSQVPDMKQLIPISTNIGKYSTGTQYDYSINAIGKNLYSGTNITISRSYHEFDLTPITSGATNINITSVKVIYSTENKSYNFKLTKVNTIS